MTPADYTTVKWLADGKEVFVGASIDQPFEAGDYTLKIVAVTARGKETSRTMSLKVAALAGDPQSSSSKLEERLVKAGASVRLHGDHLANVTKVSVAGKEADAAYDAAEGCITYTVPAGIADGTYRLSLINGQHESFGAGKVTVITKATVSKPTVDGLMDGGSVTLDGLFLDQVATITVGGKECAITAKSDSKLTIAVPAMDVDNYELKGTDVNGEALQFFTDDGLAQAGTYRVSLEKVLLEGNYVINWDAAICCLEPAKLAEVPVGATILVYYEVPAAEYHNLRIITPWWNDLPGGKQIDVTDDTPNPFALQYTEEFKSMVNEQGGMSCVGFGYTVKRITYK
mgnify:CR=1 FL=1